MDDAGWLTDLQTVKALAGELVACGAPIKDVEKNFKSAFVNHAKAAHESVAGFQVRYKPTDALRFETCCRIDHG